MIETIKSVMLLAFTTWMVASLGYIIVAIIRDAFDTSDDNGKWEYKS